MWNTYSSHCMHQVIRDLLSQVCQMADKWRRPSPQAFGMLVAATLGISRIDHWYSDIEETKPCYLIAQRLSLLWRAALVHSNTSLGIDNETREALVAKLDIINQEWLNSAEWDTEGRFHIRFRSGVGQRQADAAAKANAKARSELEEIAIARMKASSAKRKGKKKAKVKIHTAMKSKDMKAKATTKGVKKTMRKPASAKH